MMFASLTVELSVFIPTHITRRSDWSILSDLEDVAASTILAFDHYITELFVYLVAEPVLAVQTQASLL